MGIETRLRRALLVLRLTVSTQRDEARRAAQLLDAACGF